ncbi:SUKH-4 family immunity protein, partial [Streptomyces sp. NPDC001817]|uniref:SUKH-4 family immunity protein n=1 Tax=Streptomyces sp. NPDC001817 TaxID=3154398 RepID=UPI00332667DC
PLRPQLHITQGLHARINESPHQPTRTSPVVLEEERPEYDAEASTDEGVDPEGAADRLLHRMRQADPVAMENPESFWFAVLGHVRNLLRD